MTYNVIGLDLSASSTGVCLPNGETLTIKQPKLPKGQTKRDLSADLTRLVHHRSSAKKILGGYDPGLVVIEDYARGLQSAAAHVLGEIGGIYKELAWWHGWDVLVVNVSQLKVYATGSTAKIEKGHMQVAAYKAIKYGTTDPTGKEFANDDECDAWWLWAFGMHRIGYPFLKRTAAMEATISKAEVAMVAGNLPW